MSSQQKTLQKDQIQAFYHDLFVESQVRDFIKLLGASLDPVSDRVVDVGGGCGFFARSLEQRCGLRVRVLDTDTESIASCRRAGIEATMDDALNPKIVGDESVICFNLILHHLVGHTEGETRRLQERALSAWHSRARAVYVNEYVYESFLVRDLSGWLIYQITSSSWLSKLGGGIARFVPSLKANTFGVGVRFRSSKAWSDIFESVGFNVVDRVIGDEEHVSLPRRMLLIKSCRRDSFRLEPQSCTGEAD